MAKEKTKAVTITMTETQKSKALKDSAKIFGKENLSGYIQYLIQQG